MDIEVEDLELIEEVKRLSNDILTIYRLLASLEIQNRKGSIEYKNSIRRLKELLKEENEIYDSLKDDIKRTYRIVNYLFTSGQFSLPDELEYVKRLDYSALVSFRISFKLNDLIIKTPFSEDDFDFSYLFDSEELSETEDILDELEEEIEAAEDEEYEEPIMEESEIKDVEKAFEKHANILAAVENDIINTILSMMERYSKEEEYQDIGPDLIHRKYFLAYVYPTTEEALVASNFTVPNELYWTSYFTGGTYNQDDDDTKDVIRDYIVDIISNQFDAYYDARDEEDPRIRKIKIAFTEIILRASMIFFNDGEIKDLKELMEMDESELKQDEAIKASLNKAFASREKDSSMPFILSLRLPRI